MRASDLSTHPLVSRRAVLGVASLILLGGCTSAAEQAHQKFFAAVKADPLFTWRPDWTTTDELSERSGNQLFTDDDGADLTRLLGGSPVPTGATDAAAAFAISVGWDPEDPTFFRKNLKTKKDIAGCRLQIFTYDDMTGLFLKFVSWTPTS